ncbi:DM13 domain-containing protein [Paenibacillus sp. PL2-23]|uniref:DM13 domain-containing protein n=1 Tax=Paenibacillus sp. PL2-23 TaxID=2100729 RepID=UPI0030F91DB7
MMNKKMVAALGGLAVAGAVLAGGWWLASPLFLSQQVDEALPPAPSPTVVERQVEGELKPDASATQLPDKPDKTAANQDESSTSESASEEWSGAFVDGDERHQASGQVFVVLGNDGKRYLRFEGLHVTNGPDLYVYLKQEGMETSDGIKLDKLKGNLGNQNYELPADLDLGSHSVVVIWCKAFDVDFGTALLKKGGA